MAGEPLTGRATFPPQEDYQGQHQASQCWPHKAPKADSRLLSVSFSRQDLPVRRHHFGAGFLAFFLVAMFSSSSKVDKIFQRPNASTASEVYASDVANKKFFARRRVERGFPATLARLPVPRMDAARNCRSPARGVDAVRRARASVLLPAAREISPILRNCRKCTFSMPFT